MTGAGPLRMSASRRVILSLCALLALAGCGAHVLPEIRSESDRLATARRLHDQGDYGVAAELLKTYTSGSAGAADVDQAVYLLGDCYLRTKEWALAAGEFERLLKDYPESDSSGAASFRLGEAYFGQARGEDFDQEFTIKALDQWQSYLRGNPGHWLNAEAGRRALAARTRLARKLVATGQLYLKMRFGAPARFYFQQVADQYSDTQAKPEADLGLALANVYEGRRDLAVAQLREVEAQYPGTKTAARAARERGRIERR